MPSKCPHCGGKIAEASARCNAATTASITLPSDAVFLRRELYRELAVRLSRLPVSSREVPNWIADRVFFYEGEVRSVDGHLVVVGDEEIDRAFSDPDFRWIRSFRKNADRPLHQQPQKRLIHRLRLIWLALEIEGRRSEG
jgi:hypothetical protein